MARVVLENISKVFNGSKGEAIYAVKDVSLTVEDQEFVVLVGPSGCGKSTTLRMVAGLEQTTRGTISIDGRVVNQIEPKDRDIAMVFQNYALYPHMTVYENMAFGLKMRKFPRLEIQRRVGETAEMLGLMPLLDRLPNALSGGQRQRVAVGRAIVRQPKAFLFDEPLSNLDAKMRVQMRLEISKLHRRLAATMIYVTHDQVEAMTLGDRIVVMRDGMIQQVADPLGLYHQPANLFVAGFIGSPPMNFFRGSLERASGGLLFRAQATGNGDRANELTRPAGSQRILDAHSRGQPLTLRVPEALVGGLAGLVAKPVVLGLRPEDIAGATPGDGAPGEDAIIATVELVEPLGAETYLHLTTRGHTFVARVHPGHRVLAGQTMPVRFDLAKAHFFDGVSETAVNRANPK